VSRPYRLYAKASVRLSVTEKEQLRFPRVSTVFIYVCYGESNATINASIQHSNSAHVSDWLQAATMHLKTMHLKLRPSCCRLLLLTACRNSSTPYPTVLSPTFYDLRFSHNTCVTDKQTDDKQTTDRRHIVHKTRL